MFQIRFRLRAAFGWPFFLFFISQFAFAATPESVAQSRYWKLLLHYRTGWFGGEKSEADGTGFFLSPTGNTDPLAELQADIKAFDSNETIPFEEKRVQPQCAFPERYRFLKSELQLPIRNRPCPDFEAWKKMFRPKSVTLVYAAPYLGSPASMFGHSFLRVDGEKKSDLLALAISYEAITGVDAGIGYAIKGVIGLFPGKFSLTPYYLKTNIYSNMESRDLWEYPLSLTPEQIDRMLSHAWETATTHFNYYFFSRNCSYHILSLLEVANPDWDLRSHFLIDTIPANTIRVLARVPGAIESERVRPSLLAVLEARLKQMTPVEHAEFVASQEHFSDSSPIDAAVLDAMLDWQKYRVSNESRTLNDPEKQVERSLLIARSKIHEASPPPVVTATPPEQGHPSTKVSIGAGADDGRALTSFEFRPALHDLLDSNAGYLNNSSLTLGKVVLDELPSHYFRVNEVTLAEVTSRSARTIIQKNWAWTMSGGLYHPRDIECDHCLLGRVQGGWGASLPLFENGVIYGLAKARVEAGPDLAPYFRYGPSAEVGILTPLVSDLKMKFSVEYLKLFENAGVPSHYPILNGELSYPLSQRVELRAKTENYFFPTGVDYRSVFLLGYYF